MNEKDIISTKQFDLLIACLVISVVIYISNDLGVGYIINYLILGIGFMILAFLSYVALLQASNPFGK